MIPQLFEAFSSELALLVGITCLGIMRGFSADDDNTSVPITAVTLLFSTVFALIATEHTGGLPLIEQDGLATFARTAINLLSLTCLFLSLGKIGRWDQRLFSASVLVLVLACHLLVISKSGQVLFSALALLGVSLSTLIPLLKGKSQGWSSLGEGVAGAVLLLVGFTLLSGFSGSLEYGDIVQNIRERPLLSLSYGIPGVILAWSGLSWVTGLIPNLGRIPRLARTLPLWALPLVALVPALSGVCGCLRLLLKGLCFAATADHWEPLWPVEISKALALLGLAQAGLCALASLKSRGVGHLLGYTVACHFGLLVVFFSTLQRTMVEATLFYLVVLCGLVVSLCGALSQRSGDEEPEQVIGQMSSIPLLLSTGLGILPLLMGIFRIEFLHGSLFFLLVGGASLLLAALNGFALLRLWTLQPKSDRRQLPRRQLAFWGVATAGIAILTPTALRAIHFLLLDLV